jgi:hypothetical protein
MSAAALLLLRFLLLLTFVKVLFQFNTKKQSSKVSALVNILSTVTGGLLTTVRTLHISIKQLM